MSMSLKSIADKANKHKEALKDLEAQNKEYWLSSLYTLLECPKIIAEYFVSCAQKGLYECIISRGWLYSKIKERNNSFDLGIESDEFILLYLFCLKNIIETYEEKYDILCYSMFCHNKEYIAPELKVNWKGSDTKGKSEAKNEDKSDLDCMIESLAATSALFFGLAIFSALGIVFLQVLSALLIITFLITDIYLAFRVLFSNDEMEAHANKNANNDIRQFNGIYEAMLTVTKEQELKEAYTKIVDILSSNKNIADSNENEVYTYTYM